MKKKITNPKLNAFIEGNAHENPEGNNPRQIGEAEESEFTKATVSFNRKFLKEVDKFVKDRPALRSRSHFIETALREQMKRLERKGE